MMLAAGALLIGVIVGFVAGAITMLELYVRMPEGMHVKFEPPKIQGSCRYESEL